MDLPKYAYADASSAATMPLPPVTRDALPRVAVTKAPKEGRDPLNAIDLRTPTNSSDGPDRGHANPATPCEKFGPRKSERLLAKTKVGRDSSRANIFDKAATTIRDAQPPRFIRQKGAPLGKRFDHRLNETSHRVNADSSGTQASLGLATGKAKPDVNIDNHPLAVHESRSDIVTHNTRILTLSAASHPVAIDRPQTNAHATYAYRHRPPYPPPYDISTSITRMLPYGLYYYPPVQGGCFPVLNTANTQENTISQDGRAVPDLDIGPPQH